jgi:hypothetical protein
MHDFRNQIQESDKSLGRGWATIEVVGGLAVMGFGLLLPLLVLTHPYRRVDFDLWPVEAGVALFGLGGYLTLAGHRSYLYRATIATRSP